MCRAVSPSPSKPVALVAPSSACAAEALELGAVDDQLADQVHQRVELLDVDADRPGGRGRCAAIGPAELGSAAGSDGRLPPGAATSCSGATVALAMSPTASRSAWTASGSSAVSSVTLRSALDLLALDLLLARLGGRGSAGLAEGEQGLNARTASIDGRVVEDDLGPQDREPGRPRPGGWSLWPARRSAASQRARGRGRPTRGS